jgi:uncharacterized protein YqfB (UPF0267 family)
MITLLFSQKRIWFYSHPDRHQVVQESSMDLMEDTEPAQVLERLKGIQDKGHSEKIMIVHPNNSVAYENLISSLKNLLLTDPSTDLFFTTPIHYPLLWNTIENTDEKIVLMEATEGQAHVFYYIPEAVQHQRLSSMKQVSDKEGAQNVIEKLVRDLSHLGLRVQSEELGDIYQNILNEKYDGLSLAKEGDYSKIRADFNVDDDLVRSSYEKNNRHLNNYINSELINKYGINRILLAGDYFEKAASDVFLEHACQDTNVRIETLYEQKETLRQIAEGVGKMAYLKLDQLRKEALEQEKKRLEARKKLIRQIEEEVQDPEQRSFYLQKFKEAAEKENIPFEIIQWHIENKLQDYELREELEQVNDQLHKDRIPLQWDTDDKREESKAGTVNTDMEEESIIVDDDDAEPMNLEEIKESSSEKESLDLPEEEDYPIGSIKPKSEKDELEDQELEQQLVQELEAFEVTDFSWPDNTEKTLQLENIIQTERIYPNSEFILLKGKIKGSKIDRIFRIISTNELDRIENLQKFRRLYERVSRYYDNVSKIFRSNFGLFYYRDFIEGVPLNRYIRQHGIDKKEHLRDLSSEDLKLIFHLWKEVKEMDFSYTTFQSHNIIVTKDVKWNLSEEISVKFTGIRSDVSTKEEMEERLHEVLNELLYDGVYEAFKEKFI